MKRERNASRAKVAFTAILCVALSHQPALAFGVDYGKFKAGAKTFVCFDGTYLLNTENLADHKATLKPGDELEILAPSEKTATLHALKDNYYRVKVGGIEGFVWGGQLAKAYVPLKANPGAAVDAILVVGMQGILAGPGGHAAIAEVIRNHSIVSRCRFGAIETPDDQRFSYTLDLVPWTEAKFSGDPKLFRAEFRYEACDYTNGDAILVLRGDQIRHAVDAMASSNDVGGRSYKYVLPTDKGGAKDRLGIVYTEGLNTEKKHHVTRETLVWNGRYFEPPARSADLPAAKRLWQDSPENGGAF
jgi:hypothetical protein